MNLIKRNGHELWNAHDFMTELQREMNKLFGRTLQRKNDWAKAFEPEIDLVDEKDSFVVKTDLPGMKKEDFDLKVEGRLLTVKGERKEEKETNEKNYYTSERFYGAFTRVVELPGDVKADQVKACYKDGVLEVTLPKTENSKTKQVGIPVK